MKTQLVTAAAAIAVATGIASAQVPTTIKANVNANANVQASSSVTGGSAKAESNAAVRGNATSTAKKSDKAPSAATSTATTTKSRGGAGDEHKSAVALFVKSLLAVADRDGGIGAQVRAIAQAQNDVASSSAAALTKLETRSKWKTFFVGTDYKSVGQVRSDMAATEANLEKLQNLLASSTDAAAKAELEAQVKALQEAEAKIEAFIKAQESSFSLFGWMRSN